MIVGCGKCLLNLISCDSYVAGVRFICPVCSATSFVPNKPPEQVPIGDARWGNLTAAVERLIEETKRPQ